MTINKFLEWIQETYGLSDRHVVARAAGVLGTTVASIYHWKNGRRKLQEPTKRLMELTVEVETLRRQNGK